uniref:Uncharacterized protein n=1 Tax=Arundo donax TaxID=35708 RepID=A0A0A9TS14_ARUDO
MLLNSDNGFSIEHIIAQNAIVELMGLHSHFIPDTLLVKASCWNKHAIIELLPKDRVIFFLAYI